MQKSLDELVQAYNNGENLEELSAPAPHPSESFEVGGLDHLTPASVGEEPVGVEDPLSTEELSTSVLTSTPTISTTTPVTSESPNAVPQRDEKTEKIVISEPKKSKPASATVLDGLVIDTPVELLLLLDDNILNGNVKLHDWQIKFMVDFANENHTKESPFQAAVQACNSSGKDKYIIAACAVWLAMRYQETDCPITSSSGNQLDNQTAVHIDRLCNAVNAKLGQFWKINYRYYECKFTNPDGITRISTIKLFATDEPGKAEGFHPVDSGRKMAIFTSETKSIPADITDALERCTGFTHRVDASSPGLPVGYFYDVCTGGIPRESIEDIKTLASTQTLVYKITAYQCSHITESEIERIASKLPGGKNNVVFKSSVLAEFGTTDEMVVIPSSFVWGCIRNKSPIWFKEPHNTGGLDFSDGGAETVLVVRNGNKMIGMEAFRFQDTTDTIKYLEEKFKQWGLDNADSKIYADCCGIGKPMIDSLRLNGWKNVVYVDSRNNASEKLTYSNRGTELFFHVRELMAKRELIILEDKLLIQQLCTRYYKISTDNVHSLLTKKEQRSKGYPSPDRADGFNLCFWRYKSNIPDEKIEVLPFEQPENTEEKPSPIFDLREWANRGQKQFVPDHNNNLSELQEIIRDYNTNLQRRN